MYGYSLSVFSRPSTNIARHCLPQDGQRFATLPLMADACFASRAWCPQDGMIKSIALNNLSADPIQWPTGLACKMLLAAHDFALTFHLILITNAILNGVPFLSALAYTIHSCVRFSGGFNSSLRYCNALTCGQRQRSHRFTFNCLLKGARSQTE